MVSELLNKYIWLVQTFIRAGEKGLSMNELSHKWENRFDSPYARRSFNNHRESIEEVFGVRIECNRSTNRYYIPFAEDVADQNAEIAWLINTFTVNNALSLGKERLSGRVSVEDIPSGHLHLTTVMEAMSNNREIIINYLKYTSAAPETFTVQPYAVKESARRWYIVGYCHEREGLRVYGLDRVQSLEVSSVTFAMPSGFNVDDLFATSYGIYLPDGPGQTITFRTTHKEARYLRDLPIHHSQTEIGSDELSVTFSIFVCPNEALLMEFARRGDRAEVLAPADFRDSVAEAARRSALRYAPPAHPDSPGSPETPRQQINH